MTNLISSTLLLTIVNYDIELKLRLKLTIKEAIDNPPHAAETTDEVSPPTTEENDPSITEETTINDNACTGAPTDIDGTETYAFDSDLSFWLGSISSASPQQSLA